LKLTKWEYGKSSTNRMVMICSFYALGLILGPLDQGRNTGDIVCMRINDRHTNFEHN